MGGGLMELSAIGAEDLYLIGNPQITFFKSVYRKYTNFIRIYFTRNDRTFNIVTDNHYYIQVQD